MRTGVFRTPVLFAPSLRPLALLGRRGRGRWPTAAGVAGHAAGAVRALKRAAGGLALAPQAGPRRWRATEPALVAANAGGRPGSAAKGWSTASVQKQKLRVVNR